MQRRRIIRHRLTQQLSHVLRRSRLIRQRTMRLPLVRRRLGLCRSQGLLLYGQHRKRGQQRRRNTRRRILNNSIPNRSIQLLKNRSKARLYR